MLWYKTWRETRARLTIGALALAWICALIVLFERHSRLNADQPLTYVSYIWNAVYKDYVRGLFIMVTIILGGGSLVQERDHGTAGFTLALPVSRNRLVAVRTVVGIVEIWLLALVPAVSILALSPLTGESYPIGQAWRFSLLWAGCGAAIFGAAVLVSGVLAGEYSAWITCFLALIFYEAIVSLTALHRFPFLDLFRIMSGSGMPYFESRSHVLTGPLPWLPLAVLQLVALGFVALTCRVTQRRDY